MLQGKNITLVMGGPGSERKVSLASGAAVVKALQEKGYRAEAVDVEDRCRGIVVDTLERGGEAHARGTPRAELIILLG